MRLCLVGADFEENLGVGMIAAAAENAGHSVSVLAFNHVGESARVVASILAQRPDAVGLSIQFQHRVYEFLGLGRRLRDAGYRGHITCGGQFPSLGWKQALERAHGLDSVVLHEGENTIVDLLDALALGGRLADVPGLALRDDDGAPVRTASRALVHDLDELPASKRYRPHSKHLGVPFIPIMGSRGCWESCSYCSIVAFYKDAREYGGGGKMFRHRSPDNVAEEMAVLWHQAGGAGIFCFHDDNFLLPKPAQSLARVTRMRESLDRLGVERIGVVGKSRPDCVDDELARALRALGVVRLYIGVENASESGASHLARGTEASQSDRALRACRRAGIFVCYNLLLFEPEASTEHVGENIAFIRRHPHYPVNFCRAEPYFGTPLHHRLEAEQALSGSYLGFDYRIRDDRAELLFRICAAAFRQRNFAPDGIANRYMGVGYAAKLLEQFYRDPHGKLARMLERADELTRGISLETADYLEEALELAHGGRSSEEITRRTAHLGMRVAASDAIWHAELDQIYADMAAFGAPPVRRAPRVPAPLARLARSMMLGASIAVGTSIASGCADSVGPNDAGDAGEAGRMDIFVVDPPPPDMGVDRGTMPDHVDAGEDRGMDAGRMDIFVVDPPPPDMGLRDTGAQSSLAPGERAPAHDEVNDLFHWTDSSPRRATRSTDLPLFDPPVARLHAARDGDRVRVTLRGLRDAPASTRWEASGVVAGEGTEVEWVPASLADMLRVVVRTAGGVAILELRAKEIDGVSHSLV